MATIDEIFNAMADEGAEAGHEYLIIDPETRTITVPESERIFGVTGDELADRKYFMCPRYVGDGLDLAGMFLTVYFRTATDYEDGYLVDDVAVNGEYVTFSWLLSSSVTEYKGKVQFTVCADLPNTAEKRRPDWNTTLAEGEVLEGLDPDVGDVQADTSDVVAQLREMVTAQTAAVEAAGAAQAAEVKAQGTTTTQEAVEAIQAQGAATLATIPAEYTELEATVDRLTRDRAAAIVCRAEGTAIQVQDASNDPLQGLRIFGKSTQDGTPTPDAPVEIVSTPAPVVTVCRKNHFRLAGIGQSVTVNGLTCSIDRDGIITLDGTPTTITWLEIMYAFKSGTNPQSKNIVSLDSTERYVLSRTDIGGTVSAAVSLTVQTDTIEMYLNSPGDWAFQSGGLRRAWLTIQANVVCDNYKLALQIERGSTPTNYEPYTGQALTITTPGSLPGIPVASGGNYADANGQQWICDEVDLARGVYVQRVGSVVIDGSIAPASFAAGNKGGSVIAYSYDALNINISRNREPKLCDRLQRSADIFPASYKDCAPGEWGYNTNGSNDMFIVMNVGNFGAAAEAQAWLREHPVTFVYILAEPAEKALTDAELQAFLALHSNKSTTTVLNDAGAHMVLEYAADPKTYIDNKLAALVAANN